jgi:hypothetical protein
MHIAQLIVPERPEGHVQILQRVVIRGVCLCYQRTRQDRPQLQRRPKGRQLAYKRAMQPGTSLVLQFVDARLETCKLVWRQ